jgi:hypothetical protein
MHSTFVYRLLGNCTRGNCETSAIYVDFDADSESVISFQLETFIDCVKGELFAYLSIFVPFYTTFIP